MQKRILLIDLDDERRATRVHMLRKAGHTVELRTDWLTSEELDHEDHFDLLLIALHRRDGAAAAKYSDRLVGRFPGLPILLITDGGVYAPSATVSPTIDAGEPAELIQTIAAMIAGSTHIRDISELLKSGHAERGPASAQ